MDSGAATSFVSSNFLSKLHHKLPIAKGVTKFFSANSSELKTVGRVELEVKIQGLSIPFSFHAAPDLCYQCILGLDFLQQTQAQINIPSNSLILYDGLLSLPMTSNHREIPVFTIRPTTIPPLSEAIFPASISHKKAYDFVYTADCDFIIEPSIHAPCQTLIVARALIQTQKNSTICCRVLNPSESPIRLQKGTVVAQITPVTVISPCSAQTTETNTDTIETLTMEQKMELLASKGISLQHTAVQGQHRENLVNLLVKNLDLFATSLNDLKGTTIDYALKIDTYDHPPIRKRNFRLNPEDKKECLRQIAQMAEAGIIEKCDSPWQNSIFLVQRHDATQSKRLVVDFRSLNSILNLVAWPLLTFPEILDTVAEARCVLYTSLDLKAGYYQLPLCPTTADRTAFCSPDAVNYRFTRVPMGISSAVPFFQKFMSRIMTGLPASSLIIYLDDILLLGRSEQDLLDKLSQVFDRLKMANLKLHGQKCAFSVDRVKFLGHIFTKDGIEPDQSKVELIQNLKPPRTAKEVKSILGISGYYRKFINKYSQITHPLRSLLKKMHHLFGIMIVNKL